ncbi:MAG TPA: DUF3795 domain-containing protein [Candidatus Lokiarchaeia archaeon]|nr:DUF3795 domain-containing protein [Candidatus Lokiarchaeia archaeon]
MAKKRPTEKSAALNSTNDFTDAQLVAYCGINCKACRARSQRRLQLASGFKDSLLELPLDVFSQIFPPFKNVQQVIELLDFLPQLGAQTCCTADPASCGSPSCEIRTCVKEQEFRTCAECADYASCSKLDFLKPHRQTLIADLDFIKEHGLQEYVDDVIAKFKLEPIVIG